MPLDPTDADRSLLPGGSSGSVIRFGDLSFNQILHIHLNRILYCLGLISNYSSLNEYSQNVKTLERTVSATESFLKPQLMKDKDYQKAKNELESRKIEPFSKKYAKKISGANLYDQQIKKQVVSDAAFYYLEESAKKAQELFEILIAWIDKKGYGFDDMVKTVVKPKGWKPR